jgi:RimJ/RimL family protein N-acetyltransferase
MPQPPEHAASAPAIRRLGPADASEYRALLLRGIAEEPDAYTSTAAERAALPLSWWQARTSDAADATTHTWGAFSATKLIGTVALEFNAREKIRHKATLIALYVVPEARGHGAGRALIAALLAHARDLPQLSSIQLTVTADNSSARALYERAGFRHWGVEPDAIRSQNGSLAKAHYWLPLRA